MMRNVFSTSFHNICNLLGEINKETAFKVKGQGHVIKM